MRDSVPVRLVGVKELSLARGFLLTQRGRPIELPHSAQRLIALIALVRRPIRRVYVAGTLWLDAPEDRARANLRSTLWRLRQPGCELVETSGDRLALASDVRVDVGDLTDWVHGLEEDDQLPLDDHHLDELVAADEILPDWYDDWVLLEREQFRQLRLHALEACCLRLAAAGRFGRAVELGLAAVANESLRESAHRALIRVYLAEGNVSDAIRQYQLFRRLLLNELGLEPSPRIGELVAEFLQA